MFSIKIIFLISILLLSFSVQTAHAQEETQLILSLSRNFGYSSGTGDIQGTFTMKVTGPENLSRVVFYIDGEVMGEVQGPPFELRFQTDSYPLGVHTLSAVGYTNEGSELSSNQQRREFVPAEVGWQTAGKIVLPLLGVIILAVFISIALPTIAGRGKRKQIPLGAPRSYGLIGGTICPKCGRSFGMHIWGLNLVVGKLDRCPHCGKWSLVWRASPAELRASEAAELKLADHTDLEADAQKERMRKDLEDSRYQDME